MFLALVKYYKAVKYVKAVKTAQDFLRKLIESNAYSSIHFLSGFRVWENSILVCMTSFSQLHG